MRLALRVAGMAAGLPACILLHYIWKAFGRRSPWPRRWLRWAGWCARLRVRIEGQALPGDVLFVSNHVTWLDVLALGGATGAVFVSRDDVERWPLVGWVAGLNDTIYVAREARRQVHDQTDRLRRCLATHRPVALFPEGTTEGGDEVLPFRPSLFASLFPPLPGIRVQPVAIDYGAEAGAIAWVGAEAAGANAKRVLSRPGRLAVSLRFLAPIDPASAGDRKALAASSRQEVVATLAASGAAPDPLYAGR